MGVTALALVRVAAALAVMFGVAAAATLPIVVMPVKVAIANGDRIGARRTGKFCLPAGSIRWADVGPSPMAAQLAVVRGLKATAFAARASDDTDTAPVAGYRLEASIDAAAVSACVAQRGILLVAGGRHTTRLSGQLSIRWTIVGMSGDASPRQVTTVTKLNADAPDLVLQNEMETAIAAGAAELAAQLKQENAARP